MKLLMVGSHKEVKGGISTVINQLDVFLKKSDLDYKFIPTYIESNKVAQFIFFAKKYLEIVSEIKNNEIELIHFHMSYRGSFVRKYIICKLAWKNNVPTIMHLHGSEFKKWYYSCSKPQKKLINDFLNKQSQIIVLGDEWLQFVKSIAPQSKISVVSNGVTVSNNDKANWDESGFTFLFLGVLLKRKGVFDIVNAVKIIKDTGELNKRKLEIKIIGTGKEEESLRKLIKQHNLENNIRLLGWKNQQEINKIMLESQGGILPSYNEGLPMSLLESMNYGLPMITTDVGSISSVVKNGDNGIIVKPGDVEGIAQAMLKLSDNKSKWEKLSNNSKKTIYEKFDINKSLKKIKNIYQGVLYERN